MKMLNMQRIFGPVSRHLFGFVVDTILDRSPDGFLIFEMYIIREPNKFFSAVKGTVQRDFNSVF